MRCEREIDFSHVKTFPTVLGRIRGKHHSVSSLTEAHLSNHAKCMGSQMHGLPWEGGSPHLE